jgi:pimeloyl-ACP methyl ester carboxylesterase
MTAALEQVVDEPAILCGNSLGGAVALPAEALAYFERYLPPHAIVEQPEGLGHAPQMEDPKRLAQRLLAFARDVSATGRRTTRRAAP